jgi:hypothetical protein
MVSAVLLAEIQLNHLRHSKFVGLSEDKKATEVIREEQIGAE